MLYQTDLYSSKSSEINGHIFLNGIIFFSFCHHITASSEQIYGWSRQVVFKGGWPFPVSCDSGDLSGLSYKYCTRPTLQSF